MFTRVTQGLVSPTRVTMFVSTTILLRTYGRDVSGPSRGVRPPWVSSPTSVPYGIRESFPVSLFFLVHPGLETAHQYRHYIPWDLRQVYSFLLYIPLGGKRGVEERGPRTPGTTRLLLRSSVPTAGTIPPLRGASGRRTSLSSYHGHDRTVSGEPHDLDSNESRWNWEKTNQRERSRRRVGLGRKVGTMRQRDPERNERDRDEDWKKTKDTN